MKKISQLGLIKKEKTAHGGELRKTRRGRRRRPISTKSTMHLVLRSSKASGKLSFKRFEKKICEIVMKFAEKYGVKIMDVVNVGNHLHIHLKFGNRYAYKAFIRAITGSIAMLVTGASRWKPMIVALKEAGKDGVDFWDCRPFTQIVESLAYFLNLKDYFEQNRLEGFGASREEARWIVKVDSKLRPWKYAPIETG